MAYNQQPNFWDFVNSFDPSRGEGVDHHQAPPGFPFAFSFGGAPHRHGGPRRGPGPWAWGDHDEWSAWAGEPRRPRRDGPAHHQQQEQDASETMRADSDAPDPAEVTPEDSDEGPPHPPHHPSPPHGPHGHPGPHGPHGPQGPHGHRGGPRRGRGRCGGRGGPRHGGRGGHGPPPPPPYHGFDFASMMENLNDHPFFSALREQFAPNLNTEAANESSRSSNTDNDIDTFSPPLDLFSTPTSYVLHLAIPGAKKEDVGVNWDPETSSLNIAGVIHRSGDEAFLKTLQGKGERKVGMFERKVELKGDEVDGEGIGAKLEDGVLVVTVPKVEKGWTEIRKVDIE